MVRRIVEGLNVKHAGGAGYGIFAQRRYAAGERIVRVTGTRIRDTDRRLSHRGVQIGSHIFIEPKRYSSIWFLNHSCTPSAYMDGDQLIARRTILAGEQITADYSLFTDFPTWEMNCACGATRCRKLIVPYRRLKRKPTKFVSAYLQ
jgi:SET domain-containing protein